MHPASRCSICNEYGHPTKNCPELVNPPTPGGGGGGDDDECCKKLKGIDTLPDKTVCVSIKTLNQNDRHRLLYLL